MRIMITGIPSYLMRTVDSVSGATVKHRPYFENIRTKKDVIDQVKRIANTGNYLIGEGAANSVRGHDVTYIPFWHLANSIHSPETYARLNESFDLCLFASANLLRPGYAAATESHVFELLNMPIVIMGIGIQKKENLKAELPEGTQRFLNVLKKKETFFLTRGHFTAEFLKAEGMKYVRPTGCPSLYFDPAQMKRSLSRLADPGLAESQKIAFGGYLGSVPDTIVDAHALLHKDSTASYVIQDEVIVYNMNMVGEDTTQAYDQAASRITAPTEYKHAEKWQRKRDYLVFFDTHKWRSWVSGQDFCFGRRFHGSIIGMQSGIPALMIAVDDRMREMLDFVGFPHIEASVWNREPQKKAFLQDFLSKIDVPAAIHRYSECEANFNGALKDIGIR
ncbi:polysaccharide pyruvyl transferase family protein [Phyllobacterium sp. P30BS-XVII]|uniref:polysaccharide pyruvyl transferase family protein n=1 Tax=unclassified Phyllobacterium TaxID=2638441 RepID=UPI000DD9CFB2|nr:polysaccharide pyruvyl transferase family protein [Phyllobacterium sp. P30BS-XVII]MBA8903965.1 polysaccharide pyruvyl transferase WcaK-like protein [Phyllobacterium sp. P30BS-XVII]